MKAIENNIERKTKAKLNGGENNGVKIKRKIWLA